MLLVNMVTMSLHCYFKISLHCKYTKHQLEVGVKWFFFVVGKMGTVLCDVSWTTVCHVTRRNRWRWGGCTQCETCWPALLGAKHEIIWLNLPTKVHFNRQQDNRLTLPPAPGPSIINKGAHLLCHGLSLTLSCVFLYVLVCGLLDVCVCVWLMDYSSSWQPMFPGWTLSSRGNQAWNPSQTSDMTCRMGWCSHNSLR